MGDVPVELVGSGEKVARCDRLMQGIQEIFRCVHSSLPFELPYRWVSMLAIYACARKNSRRSTSKMNNIAPKVELTGRPIHKRDMMHGFGDYVEAYAGTTNTPKDRSHWCILMYPQHNSSGSWYMFDLHTESFISRSNFKGLPMTQQVIEMVNKYATKCRPNGKAIVAGHTPYLTIRKNKELTRFGALEDLGDPPSIVEHMDDYAAYHDAGASENTTSIAEVDSSDIIAMKKAEKDFVQHEKVEVEEEGCADKNDDDHAGNEEDAHATDDDVDDHENDDDDHDEDNHDDEGNEETVVSVRRSNRIKARDRTAYHLSAKRSVEVLGDKAVDAIINELDGLIDKKKCIHAVRRNDLTKQQRKNIIRSHMLMKEKMKMGLPDKVKARLVGDGSMQDRALYPDRYSPTVSLPAVMTVLAIASKEQRHVAALDVGKAYTNADMKGEEVYIEVDKFVSDYIVKYKPALCTYREDSGKMVFRLDKALYGCIQSAKLWYDTISTALHNMGFIQNDQDMCVFNRTVTGVQLTAALYVDDLLCTCKDLTMIQKFEAELKKEYGEVSSDYGDTAGRISYLGMTIKRQRAGIRISMDDYVQDMLTFLPPDGDIRKANTPAGENLFDIDSESPLLDKTDQERFHSTVAKALYLCLRVRPDIAVTVSFLTTRVSCSTQQDWGKLMRMLKYLQQNPIRGILLPTKGEISIETYIDAAFCIHSDGKSHTGVIVRIGGALVYTKSTKQKIVSRDSTESETIGLSDHTDRVLWFQHFLESQGHSPGSPVIFQDNKSTISLVTKGGGNPRTRHLRARQYGVKQQIDNNEYSVEYCVTEGMIADVLTKPLQGAKFNLFIDSMTMDY
jgi:hypothetical protein